MFVSLSMLVWLSGSVCVAYLLPKVLRHVMRMRKIKKALQQLPSSQCHWALGHLLEFNGIGPTAVEYYVGCVKERPRLDVLWIGNWVLGVVRVWHPETVKHVLKSSAPKWVHYGPMQFGKEWLGDCLLATSGDKWLRNRRLMTPAFHSTSLNKYLSVQNHCANTLLNKLLSFADSGKSVEVFDRFAKFGGDVGLRCFFSMQTSIQDDAPNAQAYMDGVKELTNLWTRRAFRPWVYSDWAYRLTGEGRQWRKTVQTVQRFIESIITEKKKSIKENKKTGDFLEMLMDYRDEEGGAMSFEELRDEVNIIMFGSHATLSSAMTWTAYSLACNPVEQKKCQEEVDELMDGREDDDITSEDLGKLPYLTRCIKEALRLNTPLPLGLRELTQPLVIDNVELPAYTNVQVLYAGMNINEQIWTEPLKYNPDRFLADNMERMDPYSFLPFSAGQRNCLGQNFAMNELKIIFSKLLRKVTLKEDAERLPRHYVSLTMKSVDGVYLYVEKRK